MFWGNSSSFPLPRPPRWPHACDLHMKLSGIPPHVRELLDYLRLRPESYSSDELPQRGAPEVPGHPLTMEGGPASRVALLLHLDQAHDVLPVPTSSGSAESSRSIATMSARFQVQGAHGAQRPADQHSKRSSLAHVGRTTAEHNARARLVANDVDVLHGAHCPPAARRGDSQSVGGPLIGRGHRPRSSCSSPRLETWIVACGTPLDGLDHGEHHSRTPTASWDIHVARSSP